VRDFLEKFELFLTEDLGREPKIFFDEQDILAGARWPDTLEKALGRSKILVAIWSVKYFTREWCNKECGIMYYREMMLNATRKEDPYCLLMPVRFLDGDNYPPFAKEIQHLNCEVYNKATKISRGHTNKFMALREAVKGWTPDVKRRIQSAPDWNSQWLTKEWMDAALKHWKEHDKFKLEKDWANPPKMG
jgi:hypothetical protein